MKDLWVEEKVGDFLRNSYKIQKKLFSEQSTFQKVEVFDSPYFGKMLFNDDLAMVSDKDEFVYHEMISHVPLYTHPNPTKVLIIGGGDGGTAREVLRHKSVELCVMVEIDEAVVRACLEHIPSCSKDLNHPKLKLIIDDGIKYVKETKEKFDVILVDSTDPIGPAQPLFGVEFYQDIFKCLNDDGIVVSQCENPWHEITMQKKLLSILSEVYPIVNIYNYHNLTYPSGTWSFSFASKKYCPLTSFSEVNFSKNNLDYRYYNQELHRAAFALPEFMKKELKQYLKNR